MFMTSICKKNISAQVRLIHADRMSSYNFIVLKKKNNRQQLKQDILNQWESMVFSKLNMSYANNRSYVSYRLRDM